MSERQGRIEHTVRKACRGRSDEPLVQVAYKLARELDLGVDDKAFAGMARELRITLDTIGVALGGQQEAKTVADELRAKRAARQAAATTQQHPSVREH